MIEEIGIIDARKIITAIRENYRIDFSNYALTALKRRFAYAWYNSGAKNIDDLVQKLNSRTFFDDFLFNVCVDTTEMFRDPSVWRVLKIDFLSRIEKEVSYKIWLPDCASGEELYSLTIILKEMNLLEKVKIFASNISFKKIEFIKAGVYAMKREDVNTANYERANGEAELTDYMTEKNNKIYMDTDLIKDVEFINTTSLATKMPEGIKLVLFRNSLIYYNKTLQNDVIQALFKSLLSGGFLFIGIKESLNSISADKMFRTVNEVERIYQKIP